MKKQFSHAYIYAHNGETLLVTVYKQSVYVSGEWIRDLEVCEIDKTFSITSTVNGRYYIHNIFILNLIKSAKIQYLQYYSEDEIVIGGKSGCFSPRRGDIAILTENDPHYNSEKDFNLVKGNCKGDLLFPGFHEPCPIIKVKETAMADA